jgi:hypothetical protein
VPAPLYGAFSSRGPLTAGGGDLLKPDIIAPGQDIIAAVAPTPPNAGFSFNLYSGTSMSSPACRGTGCAAQEPASGLDADDDQVALMTSASDVIEDRTRLRPSSSARAADTPRRMLPRTRA